MAKSKFTGMFADAEEATREGESADNRVDKLLEAFIARPDIISS